jgi:hypothetical protein
MGGAAIFLWHPLQTNCGAHPLKYTTGISASFMHGKLVYLAQYITDENRHRNLSAVNFFHVCNDIRDQFVYMPKYREVQYGLSQGRPVNSLTCRLQVDVNYGQKVTTFC